MESWLDELSTSHNSFHSTKFVGTACHAGTNLGKDRAAALLRPAFSHWGTFSNATPSGGPKEIVMIVSSSI